jgi:hypothetical protein
VLDGKARLRPRLETSDHVGSTLESKVLQPASGKAGRVSVSANQDDLPVESAHGRIAVGGRRVHPPLKDAQWKTHRSRDGSVLIDLVRGSCVDQHGPRAHRLESLARFEPPQRAARLSQEVVDRLARNLGQSALPFSRSRPLPDDPIDAGNGSRGPMMANLGPRCKRKQRRRPSRVSRVPGVGCGGACAWPRKGLSFTLPQLLWWRSSRDGWGTRS